MSEILGSPISRPSKKPNQKDPINNRGPNSLLSMKIEKTKNEMHEKKQACRDDHMWVWPCAHVGNGIQMLIVEIPRETHGRAPAAILVGLIHPPASS